MKLTNVFRLAAALAVFAWSYAGATGQGTAFTYQGQLNANSIATEAGQTYQFTFTLWDAVTGGTQHGPALTPAITVGNGGLFTVDLDFGQIFTGTQYWLDIKVGTTTGNEQELTARQPIYTVPVAQYALSAPVPSPTYMSSTASATLTTISGGASGQVAVLPLSGFTPTAFSTTLGFGPTGPIDLTPNTSGNSAPAPQIFGSNGTIGSIRGTAFAAAVGVFIGAQVTLSAQVYSSNGSGPLVFLIPGAACTFSPSIVNIFSNGDQYTCATTGLSIPYAAGDSAVVVVSATASPTGSTTVVSIPISVSVTVGP